ncbi:MAG: cytochrome D1 [Gammaproteobacteria bacterium]|nr:cytochrome D1 [Gammaproteobacteria bacterium]
MTRTTSLQSLTKFLIVLVSTAAILLPVSYAAQTKPAASGQLVKHGIVVDFEAFPVGDAADGLVEGQLAEMRFRLTEEATGAPVTGITPGVWMDMGQVIQDKSGAEQKSCKEKIALYLKGVVGIRPMLDLNSYYVVVMNKEGSLSIIDPLVSMVGKTSTLGMIRLRGPGSDWVKSQNEKRLFVSIPSTGHLAVVDTEAFKLTTDIEVGEWPTRVAMQPDGRFVWVGNNANTEEASGVTVIDAGTFQVVASVATGMGHHEIAFTEDNRYAFVSNRDAGTVSVIDVESRQKIKDIETGPVPISLAYSALSQSLYVSDGKAGTVTVIDGNDLEVKRQIALDSGLGPLRFTPDNRYALTVNPSKNVVFVIDAASNKHIQTIEVAGKPFQLAFSRAFAYVRSLANERVTMINLISLGEGKEPIVMGFAAGGSAPQLAGDLPLADSITFTTSEAAVFVVNPADNTTYFYMEGMNAPAGNYKVFGASARAVTVVDRSLREQEPGVYVSTVKIPAAGRYDVAFMLNTPELLHCFSASASANPLLENSVGGVAIEYLQNDRLTTAGSEFSLRFRISDSGTGEPKSGLKDVSVRYFRTPGTDRREVFAEEEGDGVYRALLPLGRAGGYYAYVGIRSQNIGYNDLPYFSVAATRQSAEKK